MDHATLRRIRCAIAAMRRRDAAAPTTLGAIVAHGKHALEGTVSAYKRTVCAKVKV